MISSLERFIEDLYPFYIKIDKLNNILVIGKSLEKVLSGAVKNNFHQHFIVVRPTVSVYHFEVLKHYEKQLIILQSAEKPDLILRGELKYEETENVIYFLGSPWVLNFSRLKQLGLHFSDFSVSDSIKDVLAITEQYQTTIEDTFELVNTLRERTEKTNVVFNSLAEIIFQTDNDGKWTFLNKAWEKTMGFTVEESINTLFFNYLHPDDVQKNWELFLPLINREKSYCNHQIRYVTKNNEIKWIRVYATLIIDQNNETQGTAGTLLDITKEVESENQLKLILDNVRDEISLVDRNDDYIFASPSLLANRGYKNLQELKDNKTSNTVHPDDYKRVWNYINDGEKNIDFEYRVKVLSGEYKLYSGHSMVINDTTYNKEYLLTVARNIDQERKTEKLLALITNNLTDEITMFDLKGNYLYGSPSVLKNRGHKNLAALQSTNAFDIVPDEYIKLMLQNLKTNGVHSAERKYIKKNGETTWYESSLVIITDEISNEEYILSVSRNIDEKKKYEKHIELITNNINDEITMFDFDGNYLYATPSTLINRGYNSFEEMKKHDAFSIVTEAEKEAILTNINTYGEYSLERKYTKKDGTTSWYESYSKLVKDEFNNTKYIIAVSRNIDSRKKAQLQIEQTLEKERELNRLKTEFIATSSHEFKTPLAIIKNNIEILINYSNNKISNIDDSKDLQKKFLGRIDNEIDRMLQLMNDTLILEKANNNILAVNKEKTDLLMLLVNIAERFNLLQKDGRHIQLKHKNKPKSVNVDKELIDHVFQNLISNAYKYSLGKKEPEMMISYLDRHVEITIRDYGIGIKQHEIPQLFKPFNRGSNTQGIAGTGMGLSIVKKILDLHDADIKVTSQLNVGTIFIIELPYFKL